MAMTGAMAGEAAMRNPVDVKNMETAANTRTRRTRETGRGLKRDAAGSVIESAQML